MRKVMWIVALAALAWCGWWWFASAGLRGAVQTWFDAQRAQGWQAEVGAVEGGGFPLTLQAGLRDIALADPAAGLAIETEALDIAAPAWWPGDVTVTLDDAPILIASPLGQSTLTMADGVMALNLHPGTALELEALGWTAGPWQVDDADGLRMQANDLTLTMEQVEGAQYALVATADTFTPGAATRRGLRLPENFPRAFDSLQLRADVTFDQPWDRRALDQRRPQPRVVDLHLVEAIWGDMKFNLSADLTVDVQGVPTGTIAIQAENWRDMLDMSEAAGLLPTQLRGQAEGVLQALAGASGNENTLDVELSVRDGAIRLGFIPLAPAPRLILR
ncbi:hypothetical protein GCM10007385_22340 [Tateyamaria omphalii]|uniref:DUF2125 domain-containing protein n=1 Tax=Tateyamaria omphalii TaxID=299262 RepID=UPI00167682C4|nr:DUF2125 domain-containing protein [Tateyamaria omphalii]GGX53722.1 hypothetical protein GCM10007385_22340 [Tateyamaria omphalii]